MRLLPRRRLRQSKFQDCWQELTASCANRKTWPDAIAKADELMFKALKQKGYKGHTTGEKLVAAQHQLNFNEAVWFAHKYANKLKDNPVDVRKLKKNDVLQALAGFRQALRDLGALKNKDDN